MSTKLFTIDTLPGIQRDGTLLDRQAYSDGKWVRFQRGKPRKIGGYREIVDTADGLSRGIYVRSADGVNQIFNGYSYGLERIDVDNNGIGAGTNEFEFGGAILTLSGLVGGSLYTPGTYTGVPLTGGTVESAEATIVVGGGGDVTSVTLTTAGAYYLVGDVLSADNADIGGTGSGFTITVATVDAQFTSVASHVWQFDSMFDSGGSGDDLLLGHPGHNLVQIDATTNSAVLAGNINGLVTTPLTDTSGSTPTGDTISVSGGVVVLHPYVFVYGDNGLIKNCSAGNPFDWNGADANEGNFASTKIVKGLPVRGGSNSPSGLFWALDSLIRVSYAPATVGASTVYWRYDVISAQSSILSSSSVIEYDGIYYWAGIDRFLLYNGTVKEIPNPFNQNYFYDNLNYTQRQKVWVNKVPRFGEIWWFFPSGDSEECNDCVIYNVRENCWYDAGQSPGCSRTAGYFSQVFRFPVSADATLSTSTTIFTSDIATVNGSDEIEILITNQIATGQLVVAAGIPDDTLVMLIAPSITPGYYTVTLSADATATATVSANFMTVAGKITIWQNEIGTDEVIGATTSAIESYFTTSELGLVQGNPAQTNPVGDNVWLHIDHVEPDFVQSGEMTVEVIGRPYAQAEDETSDPYPFDPDTHKVDMREQRRELRLKFSSNTQGGDYEMGRVLLGVDMGDVRGY